MRWADEFSALRCRYGERVGVVDQEGAHTIASVMDQAAGIADRLNE